MRYVGGKSRQAKKILNALLKHRGDRRKYIEPFVGGGSVLATIAPHFSTVFAGDIVPDLILFWQAVSRGWLPPQQISKEDYESLLRSDPSPMRAWAGFAASYNGRWWGGYGPKAAGRDYLAESYRSTVSKSVGIALAELRCCSFEKWRHDVDGNTVIYCDPPYKDDSGNNHSGLATPEGTGDKIYGATMFDHGQFWSEMDEWEQRGALVFVHEYTAPEGWIPVYSEARVETMNHRDKSSGRRTEALWTKGASART
jgi:site-specific DNA-adenine methylase